MTCTTCHRKARAVATRDAEIAEWDRAMGCDE